MRTKGTIGSGRFTSALTGKGAAYQLTVALTGAGAGLFETLSWGKVYYG
jgi:hypothetical protein